MGTWMQDAKATLKGITVDAFRQIQAAGARKVLEVHGVEEALEKVRGYQGREVYEYVGFDRVAGQELRISIKDYTENYQKTGLARYKVVWNDPKKGIQDQWLHLNQVRGLLHAYDPAKRPTDVHPVVKRTLSTPADVATLKRRVLDFKHPTLVMMVGLPASGKSTYATQLADILDAVYLSTDDIRKEMFGDTWSEDQHGALYKEIIRLTRAALQQGRHVVVDGTHVAAKRRYGFLKQFGKNVPRMCCFVDAPVSLCEERNDQRPTGRRVPNEYMKRYRQNLQVPQSEEGW